MSIRAPSQDSGYDSFYREFDSPLMRQLRREAYGEDLGQHSWVIASELHQDTSRLELSPSSRFLDLGCGPCGPLTYALGSVGCHGTGTDVSAAALAVGRSRATALGVDHLMTVREIDLNEGLPFERDSFDAAMALDVVLHLRDRAQLFRAIALILTPGRRFLFTDAGVVTGSISDQEVTARSIHGYTQFVAPGFNERALESAGFRLLETEDRTASVLKNATGRLAAMFAHRHELEELKGAEDFERQHRYLETVSELARRRAVSRIMYLAESHAS
jgi:SAM-dependent methyltransferase